MACSLNTISTIDDLSRIRAVLLPHLLDSVSEPEYPTTDTDFTEDDEQPSETFEICLFVLKRMVC